MLMHMALVLLLLCCGGGMGRGGGWCQGCAVGAVAQRMGLVRVYGALHYSQWSHIWPCSSQPGPSGRLLMLLMPGHHSQYALLPGSAAVSLATA
jgi:hypothetical protein